jgi:transmembrane sensor
LTYSRIAATLVIVLGLGSLIAFFVKDKNTNAVTYTATQTSNTIKLQDGTAVTIAPHSSLSADKEFGKSNRIVQLKGSAYFSVVHKEDLPLIIDAGNIFIKDIGTKFNVLSSINNDTIHVRVDEGIVQLFDSLGTELTLKASEAAFYIKSTKQLHAISKSKTSIQFNFVNDKLIDVVSNLSKAYNVPIELQHKTLENCTITTRFTNENIETVLSVITETVGLKYEKTSLGFVITGEKCNN